MHTSVLFLLIRRKARPKLLEYKILFELCAPKISFGTSKIGWQASSACGRHKRLPHLQATSQKVVSNYAGSATVTHGKVIYFVLNFQDDA